MSTTSFQNDINWLLIKASITAKQSLAKSAEAHNLSIMQALTLCLLEPGESVPMSEISSLLACDRSNVTGIVERLSVGEYIERRESHADRRVKIIKLTETGEKLRDKLLPKVAEKDVQNLRNLDQAEVDELKDILMKLVAVAPANVNT
jgi:DNA-binding MarR family transcriptional regulator